MGNRKKEGVAQEESQSNSSVMRKTMKKKLFIYIRFDICIGVCNMWVCSSVVCVYVVFEFVGFGFWDS